MSRTAFILSRLPDPDDALRRLADVLRAHETCRKRVCRRDECCQGGFGPPCFFDQRALFTEAVGERMQEYRELWAQTRASIRASLRKG